MLRITDPDGKVWVVLAGYVCHCTILGGEFNKICSDWAGYFCEAIKRDPPGAVALVVIGCGADANPEPRRGLEVVVDYALRLRRECAADRLWVVALQQRCALSHRLEAGTQRGGYEPDSSMIYRGQPTRLASEDENRIIAAVHDLLPDAFDAPTPKR